MKAFVIKNKENKYLAVSSENYEHYWTTIDFAHYFRFLNGTHDAKQEAEEFRNTRYPDCDVVEITIAETEDLEQDIKLDNSFWKQECDSLQETLKENYKEIEELKAKLETAEYWNKKYDNLQSQNDIQTIRKQICNKINNYIDKLIYERFEDGETECLTIDIDEFTEFLYDIEQGEK